MVSLIVQNIIDKEEQIRLKNKKIDELIEEELKDNQKPNTFKYAYPKISEIKKESRLDTGIYEKDFKQNEFLITNYKAGHSILGQSQHGFISGATPKNYLTSNSKNDYWWIAVADIEYGLMYKKIINIKIKDEINNLLEDGDILITRKGATVGKMNLFFKSISPKAFVNEDLKVLRLNASNQKKVFIGMFLNNKFGNIQLLNHGSKGTKQGLTNKNILDVFIPNFPEQKQKEIAQEYYNKQEKNTGLNLESYLQLEKQRNKKLGIFQLNMEIFKLREN